jgi:Flp pilus assembly protein TadD
MNAGFPHKPGTWSIPLSIKKGWSLMHAKFSPVCLLFVGIFAFWGSGCATHNGSQDTLQIREYHKALEQQKMSAKFEEDALKKLPEMTPGDYEVAGDNYLQQGNLPMAFVQYDKALRFAPTQERVRYKRGLLFLKKGLVKEALEDFQGIVQKNANYALAYEGLGQAFLKMDKFDDAEKNFRHAISLNNDLWQAHNFLGIICDRQRRFAEAVSEYTTAISLRPDQGHVFNNLGMSHYQNGKYEQAVLAFRNALKTDVSQEKVYNNLGLALGKLKRYPEALEAFTKAGDKAKAYNNLGVLYLAEGKYQEALAAFEKAIDSNPAYYKESHDNLQLVQKALSDRQANISSPAPALEGKKTEGMR